ncbi:hypothetical protein AB5I41_18165 [Sphingomonas sp. MMS24-JH45]
MPFPLFAFLAAAAATPPQAGADHRQGAAALDAADPATMVVEPVAMLIATFDGAGTDERDALVDRSEMIAGVSRASRRSTPRRPASCATSPSPTGRSASWATATRCQARSRSTRTRTTSSPWRNCRIISRACCATKDGSKTISRAELLTYRTGPIRADEARRRG